MLQAHLEDYFGWPYLGGAAGALVLTGVAAYFATKPSPETPLMPLDCQSRLLPVSESVAPPRDGDLFEAPSKSRMRGTMADRVSIAHAHFVGKSLIEFHGNSS